MFETEADRQIFQDGKRHWETITRTLALGYRYGVNRSSWYGREFVGGDVNRYRRKVLGIVNERGLDADGVRVLDYSQATQAAIVWWTGKLDSSVRTLTVGHVVDAYIRHYEIKSTDENRSNSAIAQRCIGPDLRRILCSDLRTYDLELWLNNLVYDGKMQRASANRVWTVLRAALNYGHEIMGVADKDRWTRIKPFANTNKPKAEYLTAKQARMLTRVMPADFKRLALAALYTGGRYRELVKMLIGHVDIPRRQVEFVFTKSGKRRHVPLTVEGTAHFESIIRGRLTGELVFLKENGKPWGNGQQWRRMNAAAKAANLGKSINFHQFRHTYGSLLAQNGISMRSLQELLGHSDQRITVQHYAHVSPERIADEVIEHLPSFSSAPEDRL